MTNKAFRLLFWGAVVCALLFRTVRLDLRPMHHDEANQAVKFGALLERGEYRYDPRDHHGPTLYYLTLPVSRLLGEKSLAAVSETTLRLVPALFGTGILLLLLLFAGGLAREAIVSAALLAAVSPVLTYYSRFYIQETILAFFLVGFIAAGWRYLRTRSPGWAAAAGFAAGMMYATKETSLVLFGALAAAGAIDRLAGPGAPATKIRKWPEGLFHLALFLAAAFVTAWLFFTSFLTNPGGLADSVRAFGGYFARAGGAGGHAEPWYYYLRMLAYSRCGRGPVWSEAFVLALAVAGSVFLFSGDRARDGRPRLVRFVFFFTIAAAAAYSVIPYKTPWNAVPFYAGAVILAGCGAAALWRAGRGSLAKAALLVLFSAGLLNLAYQDFRANFVDEANPTNPYVYAQTSPDYLKLVRTVEGIAAVSPEHAGMLIMVVAPPEETWPLPWSLRRFKRVGYWTDMRRAPKLEEAPVVIVSGSFAEEAGRILGKGYEEAFYGLRPEVVLALFVRLDLWDAYARSSRSSS
jgi:uncharacterized protein (TIGR03663 family)